MNFTKSFLYLFLLIFTFNSMAKVESANTTLKDRSKKLQLILLHGLNGDEKTFGELNQIIEEDYAGLVDVHVMTYPSLTNDKSSVIEDKYNAFHFARIINTKILAMYTQRQLNESTPLAFISHSQGGIVALKYLRYCVVQGKCQYQDGLKYLKQSKTEVHNLPGESNLGTIKNVQFISTLGTPFWGSPLANRAQDLPWLRSILKKSLPKKQIDALAAGSLSSTLERKNIVHRTIQLEAKDFVNPLPEETKFYHLGGNVNLRKVKPKDIWSYIKKKIGGLFLGKTGESDIAVEVPNARLDFIYHIENLNSRSVDEIEVQSGVTNISKSFVPLELSHVNIDFLERFGVRGMANISKSTKANSKAYKFLQYVLNDYFKKSQVEFTDEEVSKPRSFNVEIKTYLPDEIKRRLSFSFKNVEMSAGADSSGVFKTLDIKNSFIRKNKGENKEYDSVRAKNFQTLFHQGVMKTHFALDRLQVFGQKAYDFYSIDYQMKIPGWKVKDFTLKVSPSFSSYAEVHLLPYRPLSPFIVERFSEDYESYLVGAVEIIKDGKFKGIISSEILNPTSKVDQKVIGHKHSSLQEFINFYSLTTDEAENVLESCYRGRTGRKMKNYHDNIAYPHFVTEFDNDKGRRVTVKEHDEVLVMGRVSRGADSLVHQEGERKTIPAGVGVSELDRYLVSNYRIRSKHKVASNFFQNLKFERGIQWMNMRDVDILEQTRCRIKR